LSDYEKLTSILYYRWYYPGTRASLQPALEIAEEISELGERVGHRPASLIGSALLVATHLFANNLADSAAAAERVSAAYLPDEDAALVNTFGHDPLCLALSWAGLTFWALGQPDR